MRSARQAGKWSSAQYSTSWLHTNTHTHTHSQSFNDGNLDIAWKRGAVFTAKEDGLWNPTHRVSAEDVRHLRNRVEEFRFTHLMPAGSFHDITSCAPCMARWILQYSGDAATGRVQRPLPPAGPGDDSSDGVLCYL